MIQVLDLHDEDVVTAANRVRKAIDSIGQKTLVVIHGYGSTTNQYKKLTEIRNIGKSRKKKGQIAIAISGPDLNDPMVRAMFDPKTLSHLSPYIVNSGVTILKKHVYDPSLK